MTTTKKKQKKSAKAGAKPSASASASGDPLKLAELFSGGGEPWAPLLTSVLEAQADAERFIGAGRDKSVVPVRELTFQALKPHPPAEWKVVIFGQNPYPRLQSATGIAMFDNTFADWNDGQFGKVTSIRCIIKAAAMWKHKLPKSTSIADIRALLAKRNVVTPPQWFQAMLTQGVLLLNAALTASSDESMSTSQHTAFWKPAVEAIVEEILRQKEQSQHAAHKGVVFAWWGSHAKALRKTIEKLAQSYPDVKVAHVDHCNPAAQGDMFCDGNHYADVNSALKKLKLDAIDWLPEQGWNKNLQQGEAQEAQRVGDFIEKTRELHKLYLDRLAGVGDEKLDDLAPITGIAALPVPSLAEALEPIIKLFPVLNLFLNGAQSFGKRTKTKVGGKLSADEIGALFIYTTESPLYKSLNEALRQQDRAKTEPYHPYLRLLLSAITKLKGAKESLYRGVSKDLTKQYLSGRTVTWWGVSSCTPRIEVARAFIGSNGKRMLFEIASQNAVSIKSFSALTGEEELILAPGTQLKITSVKTDASGLAHVKLQELTTARLVA